MAQDEYAPNDTTTLDFEVVPGTWLTMDIQFDFLPHGISWEVENTDLGMVVLEGGDYFNDDYASEFISIEGCASNGCYALTVEDLFGNGLHYSPPGWYALSDSDGNVLGEGSGNFGSEQTHTSASKGLRWNHVKTSMTMGSVMMRKMNSTRRCPDAQIP